MNPRSSPTTVPSPRRPPPDYTQQSVKFRLFLGVAAVILLSAIVERAFDPQTRNWFRANNHPSANEKLENRLNSRGPRAVHDPPGTIVALADSKSVAEASKPGAPIDPVHRAWQQGWKDVVSRLPAADQSLLFELLHLVRPHEKVSPEKTSAAAALVERINPLWADYQAAAFQSLADLKGDDQALWIDVLRQVNDRFNNEVQPALKAATAGNLTDNQTKALLSLQQTLVSLAQAQIEDDTPVFRPAEREIWFHHLTRVQESAKPQLPKPPAPPVAYLQLQKQPATYRGQWVTVRGTARLAYRVPAPPNYLGIKEYVVYWLHPTGGPDSPILIYALEAPAGFPLPLGEGGLRSKPGEGVLFASPNRQTIREDIEVTGIFFKRCAYAAQGGTYTAPVLIAHTPHWHPAPKTATTMQPPFTTAQFITLSLITLFISSFLTAILWNFTRTRRAAA